MKVGELEIGLGNRNEERMCPKTPAPLGPFFVDFPGKGPRSKRPELVTNKLPRGLSHQTPLTFNVKRPNTGRVKRPKGELENNSNIQNKRRPGDQAIFYQNVLKHFKMTGDFPDGISWLS